MASTPPPNENNNNQTSSNSQDVQDVAKKLTALHLIATPSTADPSLGAQFKYADEDSISKEFICCICFSPFLDPVTHSNCGNMFCRQCIKTQATCPLCRSDLTTSIQPVPKPVINFLDSLKASNLRYLLSNKVVCSNCNEKVERGNIYMHQQSCPVPCPHGCGSKIAPRDQQKHEAEECSHCIMQCKAVDVGCLFKGKRPELEQHLPICPYIQLHDVLTAYKKQVDILQTQVMELEQKIAASKKKYVTIKSHYGKYLCCDTKAKVTADRLNPSTWETFQIKEVGDKYVSFKTFHGKWICAEKDGHVTGNRDHRKNFETFEKVEIQPKKWALKTHHGTYMWADSNGKVMGTSNVPYAWEISEV